MTGCPLRCIGLISVILIDNKNVLTGLYSFSDLHFPHSLLHALEDRSKCSNNHRCNRHHIPQFFSALWQDPSIRPAFHLPSLSFHGLLPRKKSTRWPALFFLLITIKTGLLTWVWWYVCILISNFISFVPISFVSKAKFQFLARFFPSPSRISSCNPFVLVCWISFICY